MIMITLFYSDVRIQLVARNFEPQAPENRNGKPVQAQ